MSNIQTQVHIRWLVRRDLIEVMAIENASFDFPWSEDQFLAHLRDRSIVGQTAELGDRVAGFWIHKINRGQYTLLDFAVDSQWRRQGIGRQMAERIARKASCMRPRVVLMVRESNLGAQQFWRACGFLATGVIREHFTDSGEDGFRFEFSRREG